MTILVIQYKGNVRRETKKTSRKPAPPKAARQKTQRPTAEPLAMLEKVVGRSTPRPSREIWQRKWFARWLRRGDWMARGSGEWTMANAVRVARKREACQRRSGAHHERIARERIAGANGTIATPGRLGAARIRWESSKHAAREKFNARTHGWLDLFRRYAEVALESSERRHAVIELSTIVEATKRLNSTLDLAELLEIILQLDHAAYGRGARDCFSGGPRAQ